MEMDSLKSKTDYGDEEEINGGVQISLQHVDTEVHTEKCKSHEKNHRHSSSGEAFGIEKSISFDSMATKLGIGGHHKKDGEHNRLINEHRRKTRAAKFRIDEETSSFSSQALSDRSKKQMQKKRHNCESSSNASSSAKSSNDPEGMEILRK